MRVRMLPALLLACACSGEGRYLVSPALRAIVDTRVAVLPFDNNSAEPGAAGIMRALAAEGLSRRGYLALPAEEVDGFLKKLRHPGGVVLTAEQGRSLGAGLLCYGSVEEFAFQRLDLVVRKEVRLRLEIVDAATGETLFEGSGSGKDFKSFPDQAAAKSYFLEQLSRGGGVPPAPALTRETRMAVAQVLDRLPRR
ncbi:MAG: hypothetical protein A2234_07055 [Elusimicrobia bacterium RIFOXYA2_FULL_58_8]|nr:MAG: hypothetical protein A2234_07055 [Elusimicrobia bacterium RIFOXYA2_FULL_58_8]OGS14096.1 MAG: hypothetical protein A2285_10625 [Elusimicrobia bacterium RIFOXYA12_FULL_57_11]